MWCNSVNLTKSRCLVGNEEVVDVHSPLHISLHKQLVNTYLPSASLIIHTLELP